MNMPIQPVTKSNVESKPSAGKDNNNNAAFSHALNNSTQKNAADDKHGKTTISKDVRTHERVIKGKTSPDETLALLIDTAALPLNNDKITINADFKDVAKATIKQSIDTDTKDKKLIDAKNKLIDLDAKDNKIAEAAIKNPVNKGSLQIEMANNAKTNVADLDLDAKDFDTNKKTKTTKIAKNINLENNKAIFTPSENLKAEGKSESLGAKGVKLELNTQNLATANSNNDVSNLVQQQTNTNNFSGNLQQATVNTYINNPNWAQDFSRQVSNLVQSNGNLGHTVQMQVNPPELGPVHITLHLNDGVTQASFISPHAAVRHAIENALPNLQDQLNQAGLSLGQADVSDQQTGQQELAQDSFKSNQESGSFSLNAANNSGVSIETTGPHLVNRSRPDALIDTFA